MSVTFIEFQTCQFIHRLALDLNTGTAATANGNKEKSKPLNVVVCIVLRGFSNHPLNQSNCLWLLEQAL